MFEKLSKINVDMDDNKLSISYDPEEMHEIAENIKDAIEKEKDNFIIKQLSDNHLRKLLGVVQVELMQRAENDPSRNR